MRTRFDATVNVATYLGADGPGVTVRVLDPDSGAQVVELRIPAASWGMALSGGGAQPCEATIAEVDRIGLVPETKVEAFPHVRGDRWEDLVVAARAGEVDGWEADGLDRFNHHRLIDGVYRVTYRRWVPKPAEAADA